MVTAGVHAQASTDPEYQALLAKQQGGAAGADAAGRAAQGPQRRGMLSQQQKEAGLASVFKRDDENLARAGAAVLVSSFAAPPSKPWCAASCCKPDSCNVLACFHVETRSGTWTVAAC